MSIFTEQLTSFLQDEQLTTIIRVARVARGGQPEVVHNQEANPCQNLYSVAKTFTMTAIGLLVDRGTLSLDERICDILRPEVPAVGMDPRMEDATVEMALTHRMGLPGGHLDIDVYPRGVFGRDYLRYLFTTPLAYDPGTEERYSDGAFYLLSRIVEAKSGEPMDNFLWRELFAPLHYREMAWSRCPMGHPMGATGLYLEAEDMVKLGQVYLEGGMYLGRRILSEAWCAMAPEKNYALHWDAAHTHYAKNGMRGQELLIYPDTDQAFAVQSCGNELGRVVDWLTENRKLF